MSFRQWGQGDDTIAIASLETRVSTEESASLSADTSQDLVTSTNLSTSTSAELSLTTRLSTEEITSAAQDYTLTGVKVGAYNAVIQDLVRCNPTGGAFAVTLPTAVGQDGKGITIKNVTSSVNAITVNTTGGQTMDALASGADSIATAYGTITYVSDGANWMRFPEV